MQEQAGIMASIMAKLAKDENVQVDTISKICDALGCQPGDITENISILQRQNMAEAEPKKIDTMTKFIIHTVENPSVPPEGTKIITGEDVKNGYGLYNAGE